MLKLGLSLISTLASAESIPAPVYVSATTNEAGTIITVTFDKTMADPSGKHAQFAVNDGSANAVTAAALNGTTTKIDLTLTNSIEVGDTVTVAYTAGTVVADDGGILESFSAESVTNIVVALYQAWSDGIGDSPELTSSYPYQNISVAGAGKPLLSISSGKFYMDGTYYKCKELAKLYGWDVSSWVSYGDFSAGNPLAFGADFTQANYDVYTDSGLGTVYFEKTT